LYLPRNYDGLHEDKYHLCDEPFDYASWKNGKITQTESPSVRALGTDSADRVVMEVSIPDKGDVYVDILNSNGELVWRLEANGLEPGKHEVVWDGFSQPGLYNIYVKGMGWDAERQMVIYT
jgi:flagellar hook assembly protein FlgD